MSILINHNGIIPFETLLSLIKDSKDNQEDLKEINAYLLDNEDHYCFSDLSILAYEVKGYIVVQ